MSFLMNLLVLTGFALIFLVFIWYMTRNNESSSTGKIFIIFFIVIGVLAFLMWMFLI